MLLLWVLALTGSRWPPIALAAVLAYTLALRIRLKGKTADSLCWCRGLAFVLAGYVAVAALIALGGSDWGVSPLGRFFEAASDDSGQAGVRRYLWKHAWIAFTEAPLIGVGIGGYRGRMFANSEQLAYMNVTGMDPNAHNLLLHLMAETGLIGAVCALAVLGLIACSLATRPPRTRTLMAASAFIVFMVYSAVEYPLWYAHLIVVFAVLVSIDGAASVQTVRRLLGPALIAGLMLFWFAVAADWWELRRLTRAATDPKTLGTFVQQREQENPRWIRGLLRPLKELVLWEGIPLAAVEPRAAALELDRIASHSPTEIMVFHHVTALWAAGRHADAITIARRAAVAMPKLLTPIENEVERRRLLGDTAWEGLADAIAKVRKERKIDSPLPN
ncbi:MAG: Wzy polymerase domain-containing protein [Burkholderiales bacterium]